MRKTHLSFVWGTLSNESLVSTFESIFMAFTWRTWKAPWLNERRNVFKLRFAIWTSLASSHRVDSTARFSQSNFTIRLEYSILGLQTTYQGIASRTSYMQRVQIRRSSSTGTFAASTGLLATSNSALFSSETPQILHSYCIHRLEHPYSFHIECSCEYHQGHQRHIAAMDAFNVSWTVVLTFIDFTETFFRQATHVIP